MFKDLVEQRWLWLYPIILILAIIHVDSQFIYTQIVSLLIETSILRTHSYPPQSSPLRFWESLRVGSRQPFP